MKKIYYLCAILFASITIFSQEIITECASEELMEHYFTNNLEAKKEYDEFNSELAKLTKSGELRKRINSKKEQQIYEIPIVVHVISKGDEIGTVNNPDDQQIIDWIDYTNEVFSGKIDGLPNDSSGGTIIPVKLVLAKIDPKGKKTNGIDRIDMSNNERFVLHGLSGVSSYEGLHDKEVIMKYGWESTKYYNIYVVHRIRSRTGNSNGYANYPTGDLSNDRSVISTSVSKAGQQTMAHEFGHGLGLIHPHEGFTAGQATRARDENGQYIRDANGDYIINVIKAAVCPVNNDCTKDGDMVCDTEPSISLYDPTVNLYRCLAGGINQCTGEVYAGVEQNIMAYTRCFRNRFTPGQIDRAMAHLLRYRESLINSPVLDNEVKDNNVTIIPASCYPIDIQNKINYKIGIVNVNFKDINNWTTPYNTLENNFYKDYTKSYTLAKTTTSIPYSSPTKLNIRTSDTTNRQTVKVYIDYNNDGVFSETNEVVLIKSNIPQNSVTSVDILPPNNTVLNTPLRMRVISDFTGTNITPCGNPRYGDVEDYAVTIVDESLSTNDNINVNKIDVVTNGTTLLVDANEIISNIIITDITGKLIYKGDRINKKTFSKDLNTKNQIYVVIVSLKNGVKHSHKVIL